ncbi:MAG: ABC transporter substrate-binding protein [Proteobacteria bacterium]|nr:ABC transporter substrate-binding protein [Pseudomonadota bacterium]
MRRRQFIPALLVATARTGGASAQGAGRPTIGFLSSRSEKDSTPHVEGFRRGLAQVGFAEGRNLTIEWRWAGGKYDRLPEMARELVDTKVSAIAAMGAAPSGLAAKAATSVIPIVFVAANPLKNGLANSYSRPSGNVTGIDIVSGELGPKRLELICKLLPSVGQIGLLLHPGNPGMAEYRQNVQAAAKQLGRSLLVASAASEAEITEAFAAMARNGVGALVVENDPFFHSRRAQFISLAARSALPAIYHIREFPDSGGLMSYGANLAEAYRQAGGYVGKLLLGAKVIDLPIARPTRIEMVFNADTAKTLGIAVPPEFFAEIDEIVE